MFCTFDIVLLFVTRILRMFSYGAITVVFMIDLLYRFEVVDKHPAATSAMYANILLSGILIGDLVITLWLTTNADRIGRQKTLLIGAALKTLAGMAFGLSDEFGVLLVAGVIGVISPTGGDVGPFVSIEQACLSQLLEEAVEDVDERKIVLTDMFAYYQLVGSVSLAFGSLAAGLFVSSFSASHFVLFGTTAVLLRPASVVFLCYAGCGLVKAFLYACLSSKVEAPAEFRKKIEVEGKSMLVGITSERTRAIVGRLSCLFALDAFAGGLALQSYMSWWFHERWNVSEDLLGETFFAVNIVAGISGLSAGWFVKRYGAIETMVFTHLPSNILLILVPLMPTRESALLMLIARFCISQMDVPARQAYVAMTVSPQERSAAGGWTNAARSVGVSLAPLLLQGIGTETAGIGSTVFNSPYLLSGGLKCVYDLTLWYSFAAQRRSDEEERLAALPKDPEGAEEGDSRHDDGKSLVGRKARVGYGAVEMRNAGAKA